MMRIVQGDITKLGVDAIVNAANQVMLGGGGVDGAIHRAAGEELFDDCLKVPEVRPGVRCPTGEARITPGFRLPAKFVIHTVGPVYRDGRHGEPEKLANCYRNSLALAVENGCKSIAFPCISTGVYGYPIEDAARIAVREAKAFLATHDIEVVFCCFSGRDKEVYEAQLKEVAENEIEVAEKVAKNAVEVAKKVAKNVSAAEMRIIECIIEIPSMSQAAISERLGMTRQYIGRCMDDLQRRQIIRRIGPKKGGHWELVEART